MNTYDMGIKRMGEMGLNKWLYTRAQVCAIGTTGTIGVTSSGQITTDLSECGGGWIITGGRVRRCATKRTDRTAVTYYGAELCELESGRMMFNIGKGQRTRKKAKINANRVIGKRSGMYGRIIARPYCV